MRSGAALVLLFLAVASARRISHRSTHEEGERLLRVLGGEEAEADKLPWMAYIEVLNATDNELIVATCGGALLNNRTIITAASCVKHVTSASQIQIYLGNVDHTVPKVMDARNWTIHPNYYANTFEWDVALIQLAAIQMQNDSIKYAELPSPKQVAKPDTFANMTALVMGWGSTVNGTKEDGTTVTVIQWGTMKVMMTKECQMMMKQIHFKVWTDSQMCTDPLLVEKGICNFDVGGPLVIVTPSNLSPMVIGISTWFEYCGTKYPNLYTGMFAKDLLKWVEKNGGPSVKKK